MTLLTSNPWTESAPEHHARRLLVALESARRSILENTRDIPDLRQPASAFCSDLEKLVGVMSQHPDAWRSIRTFLVVDLPAIQAAIHSLSIAASGSEGKEELLSLILRSFGKSSEALASVSHLSLQSDILSLQVITGEPEDRSGGSSNAISSRLSRMTQAAREGLSRSIDRSGDVAGGVATLVTAYAGQALSDTTQMISRPLTRRVAALTDSLVNTGGSALAWGAIGAVIFPPLAPFLVGEALLSLPEEYTRRLEKISEEDARRDLERRGRSAREIDMILAGIRGGSIRFETPCLSLSIDARTGKASGLVLKGKYMGCALEELDADTISMLHRKSPDTETKAALAAWMSRQTSSA